MGRVPKKGESMTHRRQSKQRVDRVQRTSDHFRSIRLAALGCASVLAISAGLTAARAQDDATSATESKAAASAGVQEVQITGTRIQRSGFTTPTPVTVVGRETMDSLGIVNIGDMIGQLPMNNAQVSPTNNSIGSVNDYVTDANIGAQTANLRGLNPFFGTRTLVLVDGHRFVPSTNTGSVDLSLIPSNLVQRTEVVTGGASAAYGSDAVAGVVNIVLDHHLEGIKGQVDYGESFRGDGGDKHFSLAGGTSLFNGRGHLIAGGEYQDSNAIGSCSSTRTWCKPYAIFDVPAAYQNGSVDGNLYPDYMLVDNATAIPTRNGFIAGALGNVAGPPFFIPAPYSLLTNYTDLPAALQGKQFSADGTKLVDRQVGKFVDPNGLTMAGGDGLPPDSGTLQRVPVKRFSLYSRFEYDVTDDITAFVESSYGERKSGRVNDSLQYALFGAGTSEAVIHADNAYLPAGVGNILTSAGLQGFVLDKDPLDGALPAPTSQLKDYTYRIVTGLNGSFGEGWSWDVYYTYGKNHQFESLENARKDTRLSVSATGIARGANYANATFDKISPFDWAVDAVVDPADNQIKCRINSSLANPTFANNPNADVHALAQACVPLDLFGVGNADPAAIQYAYGTITETTSNDQSVIGGNIQGPVLHGWAGDIIAAAGGEYRVESGGVTHGQPENYYAPDFGGDFTGKVEVAEGYVETDVPVLKDVPMVQNLDIDAAVRETHSKASSAGVSKSFNITTWKVSGVWDVVQPLRFRVTRSHDVRAPGFRELFFPGRTTAFSITNAWTGARDAVDILQNGGGNVDLKQESADTWTAGIVLQPGGIFDGLHLSVDYYDMILNNGIATVSTAGVMAACKDSGGTDILCQRIVIAPGGGDFVSGVTDIESIRTGSSNAQKLTTRGVDVEVVYNFPLAKLFEKSGAILNFRALISYLGQLKLDKSNTGSTGLQSAIGTNYAGQIGAGGVDDSASFSEAPHWQSNATVTYTNGPLHTTLQARYVGSAKLYSDLTSPDQPGYVAGAAHTININRVGSYWLFNLSLAYDFNKDSGHPIQLFGVVNNLFDRAPRIAPPIPPGGGYSITNPVYYDTIGRSFRIGVRFNY
jgi:iron complex outermembrane receptor protein